MSNALKKFIHRKRDKRDLEAFAQIICSILKTISEAQSQLQSSHYEDFQYDDIFVIDMLKEHLAFRLEQHYKTGDPDYEKLTVSETVAKYDLTRREHTILKLLMSGKDNNEICEELVIAPNTLKKHILNIYRKLGINNRVQLFKSVKEFE